jgi:tetratricopeptide (TPR) repeat protein
MKLSLMEQMSYAFDGLLVLGQIYQQQKDFTNAIRCYKSALSYDSDNVDALLLLGAAQVEAELYGTKSNIFDSFWDNTIDSGIVLEDAVHVLRKASLLDPDSVMANLYLGNSLLNLQKYEQAIIYLQKALTNAMKTQASKEIVVMLYQSLASAYSKNGNELEAEQFRAYYRQLMSRP